MPKELFGSVLQSSIRMGSRKRTVVSVILYLVAALIGLGWFGIIAPILADDTWPDPPRAIEYVYAVSVTPPNPEIPVPAKPAAPGSNRKNEGPPTKPQDGIPPDRDPEPPVDPGPPGPPGPPGSPEPGPPGPAKPTPPPEPPPPPPVPVPQTPVKPGGDIQAPVRTKDVKPVYPTIAQGARVQGVVIIECWIDVNGKVKNARILRSIPLLDQAALDAVGQWEFSPTLLNKKPVEVLMTVTVNFTLQ